MSDTHGEIPRADLAEYCRTQAAILAGQLEQRGAELSALLEEIEAEAADTRAAVEGTGDGQGNAIADPEAAVTDIEAKQERAADKEAELSEYQAVTEGYIDLAEQLAGGTGDLETVLQFEMDTDAPTYFESETTVLGVATSEGRGD